MHQQVRLKLCIRWLQGSFPKNLQIKFFQAEFEGLINS